MNDSAIPSASSETMICGVYSGFTRESYRVQSGAKSEPALTEASTQMGNHHFDTGG